MKKIFAVMGASGHVGHTVAEDLLKRGYTVRALGREEHKLHSLISKGAEPILGNFDDPTALKKAFADTEAVFCMLPPAYTEKNYLKYLDTVSETLCKALQASHVKHVVNLSSLGAHLPNGTGPIQTLYRHEARLNQLSELTSLVHLRPTFFMENFNMYLPDIKQNAPLCSSLNADIAIPMVACRDIGWKAADFLDSPPTNQPHLIFEFVGPKEVTMPQAAQIFGKAFDFPQLRFEHISYEKDKERLLSKGFSQEIANLFIEMYQAFNQKLIQPTQELKPTHHGRTTLQEFAQMAAAHHLATTSRK